MNIKTKKLMFALLLGATCNLFSRHHHDGRGIVGGILGGVADTVAVATDTALSPVVDPYYSPVVDPYYYDYYPYDYDYRPYYVNYSGGYHRGRHSKENPSRIRTSLSPRSSSTSRRG